MSFVLAALSAFLGLLVGAFAAHAAEAIMAKRSLRVPSCPYCEAPYPPLQWSVAAAWLARRGRCSECAKPLRWPRLAGELFLAAGWAVLVLRYGLAPRALFAAAALVPLEMVLVTDLEAKLIPNRIILPALLFVLPAAVLAGPAVPGANDFSWWYAPLGALVGFLTFWVLGAVGVALLGEGALGAGDVKLAAYLGAVVGWPLVIVALVLTFLLGGVGAVLVLVGRRGTGMRTAIPYGPFLVLGCATTMIAGVEIVTWFLL
jgi:leader peptidase (prepilin peptidase)/N-methyltransferase